MALYQEAASILQTCYARRGSLKSEVYNSKKAHKSNPAVIYALVSETSRWNIVLKEVVENASLLSQEPKLGQFTSMLLVHDLLLSKNGIAAPSNHPLRLATERHKARLQAELTRSRLRRSCGTLEELKEKLSSERSTIFIKKGSLQWVRINTIRTTLEQQSKSTFRGFSQSRELESFSQLQDVEKILYIDEQVPNLIAIPRSFAVTKSTAYSNGEIILQDKASCFPSHLLLNSRIDKAVGDVIDACAAPGNKTTHLAMLQNQGQCDGARIYACERDKVRTKTLQVMVKLAGADRQVTILGNTDFLALKANDPRFANVTHLLLDPSCSGSGITGREDISSFALPHKPQTHDYGPQKRKRSDQEDSLQPIPADLSTFSDAERLTKLSNLQSHVITHAFSFPAANTIVYSTCSVHSIENECVVSRVLESSIAKQRGWRLMRRDEQVSGLRDWTQRGKKSHDHNLGPSELEGCVRCGPGDRHATIGFFVCAFVRCEEDAFDCFQSTETSDLEEWDGFSDGSKNE